jgi:hypothetical protein
MISMTLTALSFQVAVEDLDRLRPCVESRPAEVGTECLDQRESYVVGVSGCSPASTLSSIQSLVRPMVVEV